MIKAVLFDLDNTLIDFMAMKKMSSRAAVLAMLDTGLNIKKETAIKKLYKMYENHGYEDQRIFNKFIKELTGKIDYKILASAIAAYRKVKIGYITPFPHARTTLLQLKQKGLKLGIVSDAPKLQAWLRLAELNFLEFFDVVVTLNDTGKLKPHKKPFEKAVKLLKLKPEEILFVGDNPERDIKGAKKIGMKTVLAKYGQYVKSKKIRADYEILDIKKITQIVKTKH